LVFAVGDEGGGDVEAEVSFVGFGVGFVIEERVAPFAIEETIIQNVFILLG